ncbi:MAG: prephenate dehydrogenase [Methanosarcinales archaeon]|nr:MAG: prephenate dehydrogenase [Methanosarcinales archaeon]
MKMLIIGGTGDTGQWFVKFFQSRGFDVHVWGKNHRFDIAKKLNVPFAEALDETIHTSDVVMISVPINRTEDMIAQTAPKMKSGSLLMDVTSIKMEAVAAMEKYTPKDVEFLGTHPMFGPGISDIRGQTVILTPTVRCKNWLPLVKKIYADSGAHIEIITPREHDEIMRVVQGLTHFAYISIGTTLEAINFDVVKSRRFMSPVYEIMLDFVGRILAQNPYLYAMIQTNPQVNDMHDIYITQCKQLSYLIKKGDVEGFVQKMKLAAVHFKNTESAQRRSDKLIHNKIVEYETLIQRTGIHCAVEHLYTNKIHTGTLAGVTPLTITLQKNKKRTTLKIENIKLLRDEEYLQWKKENTSHVTKDISVYVPEGSNPDTIRQVIQQFFPDIINNIEIIDTYLHKDKQGITYRMMMIAEKHRQTMQQITELLEGIGCTLR